MLKTNPFLQKVYSSSPALLKNIQASLYSFIVSKNKYGSNYNYWINILNESQWWDENRLLKFQSELLNNFLNDVKKYSPYYANILNSLPDEDYLKKTGDIIKLFPIIKKTDVKKHYHDILGNRNKKKLYKFSSSGTTGTALTVYLDLNSYQREYAFRSLFLAVGGAHRKSKFAYFLGNKLFSSTKTAAPFHISDYNENGIYFSIFHMSNNSLPAYIKTFNENKPEYVKGYPSALYTFANFIKQNGLTIHKPKAIYSASEVLRGYQKLLLEEIFQSPVYQWYGQVETTVNIHECDKRRLHVKEEYGYLELINVNGNDAKPGEIASAIGTGWGNKIFPLIRYDTGDNMVLSSEQKCPCGRNGRIIEQILGRDEDVIITPEGNIIGRLDFVFKPIESVMESQIVQVDINKLIVKIVPLPSFVQNDKKIITDKLKDYIGNSFSITIEEVGSLERTTAGKIKYVISKLSLDK